MKTLFALAMVPLTVAPAAAQDYGRNNEGMQTGTRFAREPEEASAVEARQMQKRVAHCVYDRNEEEVHELLLNSDFYSIDFDAVGSSNETLFDDLEVGFCMGRLTRGAGNRTYAHYMRIPYATLRNLLAEEAYLNDFDGPPQITANDVEAVAGRFQDGPVHPQIRGMASLADCLTFNGGQAAHDLLSSRPGSDEEDEAIELVGPVIATCANSGEETMTISTSLIRQMAADGLWSRSQYGSAAVEES